MPFLRGKIEVLASGVFLYKGLIFYVCHVTPLIIGNLNFFKTILSYYLYSDINVPPSRTQKGGFSAIVQQEMGQEVDISF